MKNNLTRANKKSNKPVIWIGLALILVIALSIGGYFWYRNWQAEQQAIQRQEAVETLTKSYLANYQETDYESFVEKLTPESVKAEGYTKEELSERYATVYEGIGAENIEVTNKDLSYDEETDTYHLSYSVNMETALGPLTALQFEVTVIETETDTLMAWDHSLLLPNMEQGDTVSLSYTQPKRGSIYDRDGNMLAGEGEAWQAGLYPAALGEGETRTSHLNRISDSLSVSVERLESLLEQSWVTDESFVPIHVVDETPEIPGVIYQRSLERLYPLREAAAHLIGYVGQVSAEDIEENPVLREGQYIGKAGFEALFEERLRGERGGHISLLNAEGEVKETVIENERVDGENIHLTINSTIQEELFHAFDNEPGTASMMDPNTGELLALTSSPSYDPQLFVRGISQSDYNAYLENENSPFLNRYTARYVPGSTFKIITALSLLETGATSPDKVNHIEGLQWSPETDAFGNHHITRVTSSVSEVNLETALIYSDNIFFAMEALDMGNEAFTEALSVFPFGESFGLPFDMSPAQFSNEGTLDRDTLLADTAYGQGEILMNTIHQLVFYTPAITSGELVYPSILKEEDKKENETLVSSETADFVRNSLLEVVNHPNGTARGLQSLPYAVGAKTGTAEVAGEDGNEANGLLYVFDAEDEAYSFIGFLEGKASGDVIQRFTPFLETVKNHF